MTPQSRRDFLQLTSAAALVAACRSSPGHLEKDPAARGSAHEIPKRPLGKTGLAVSILALGGSHLGEAKSQDEATRIVHEAIDAGVNFFDNAWEYHDGRSEEWLGSALAGKRDGVVLMSKVCTHGRGADVAMAQLEDSLRRLRTDHLDVWQIHECIYDNDPDLHFADGGVIAALEKAKQHGKVRFCGFTGHKDPSIHLRMLAHDYPFDTCQMPLNAFDATFRSFEKQVLPALKKRHIAPIAMKSLGGLGEPVVKGAVTVDEALRYVWSLPVATLVSGVDAIDVLHQNVALARRFTPMTDAEMDELRARCASLAGDGHFEMYKTTLRFDAKVGREQHGFPTQDELPL